ncbi:MAG: bifunctional [glutamine synthetase] adenylyltransferase/[glutamine synthetase]-adenylyl-L-tyrosine phosphorylase [Nitriliruptorales bacterium]|nr:bifunctional [glutamine synthetase] adenylyltransferase/[glutamine synthetase]-adenylyl-L-tyrosine phosphorylase [Nitriliruptorales bacterium]
MSEATTGGARDRSVDAALAAAGLDPDVARRHLDEAGLVPADGQVVADGVLDDLLDAVSGTADPMDAFVAVTALAAHQPDLFSEVRRERPWLDRIAAVAGTSRPLGDLLARYEDATRAVETLEPVSSRTVADQARNAVLSHEGRDDRAAAIASIRRAATADVAARDLTGVAEVEEVAAELSALAEGVLTGALAGLVEAETDGEPAARIAVVGMGKLGGFELNYVSDVDVIFVHAPTGDGPDAENRAAAEAKAVLEELLGLLNASTTMGRAYEIDPTLRPEGRAGPLSRTVGSFVAYWERWAKTWEFQALLKARPVAGDRELASQLLQEAEPFVYPDELDPNVVAEIREMKGRVEAKPEVVRHGQRQVKLGPGGLRDIEFAVQLLQLVHGRADRSLRITGTLPALEALARGGYIADEDAETFAEAYRMLRRVEHRLQLAKERRTHTIPDDEDRQEWLARSLGYSAEGDAPARSEFLRDLRRVQGEVRDLHSKLFFRPLLESHAAVPAEAAGVALPHEVKVMGEEAAWTRLAALGFDDPRAALRDVRALTGGVSRRARTMRAILPGMLHVLEDAPDPDTGLKALRRLVESQGSSSRLLAHLRDHPPAAELLARVLGTSEVAGELFLAHPQGVEWLLDEEVATDARTRDELVRLAQGRLGWQDVTAALRRFKRHELLRIVLRDIAGRATASTVSEELTALAEACLEAALAAEHEAVADERGVEHDGLPVTMAVIGVGRLGGRELHYPSDLDVLFVHRAGPGASDGSAGEIAAAVAERTMSSLSRITAEGTAFEVDADLRPEGRSGPLSRSLDSFEQYYARWAEPWEHQALLKARAVAGDAELGAEFEAAVRDYAYPADFDEEHVRRMRKMKARIERERIGRRVDADRHIKLGPGGLSDVEWVVQLLQKQHGHDTSLIRTTATMTAIDALQDASILAHRDAQWLRDGYRFLSAIRNRLYLMRIRNVDVMPSEVDRLERLARGLGYGRGGRQELEADRLRHKRHVRQVTERVFYGIGE